MEREEQNEGIGEMETQVANSDATAAKPSITRGRRVVTFGSRR